ncbi:unnamed protein product [Closterium sp. NIES-65]|nr:unnamed protein product [Closterium sp. NIES-65]
MCFADFQREVERKVGVPVAGQRFWLWARRQNHTYRPKRPLSAEEEGMTVRQLRDSVSKAHRKDLRVFLEGLPTPPVVAPLHERAKDDILLFLKFYNPLTETLRYVGRLFVNLGQAPADVRGKINEMCGLAPTDDILLFEEIKYEPSVMCEAMDCTVTFKGGQLDDGDIICVQRAKQLAQEGAVGTAGSGGSAVRVRYPDVPSFLEYVRNRHVVHFRRLEKPTEDAFCLELAVGSPTDMVVSSKEHTYDDVVARLAEEIGLDNPSKVRLTTHNCYSQKPKPPAIKYRGVDCLADMLVHYDQPAVKYRGVDCLTNMLVHFNQMWSTDILYFETLDIPLPELQQLKTLNITFHNSKAEDVRGGRVELWHPKANFRMLQVFINKIFPTLYTNLSALPLRTPLSLSVELSHPKAELRLLQVFYNKIYKIFPLTEQIEYINDQYWGIRAEEPSGPSTQPTDPSASTPEAQWLEEDSVHVVFKHFKVPIRPDAVGAVRVYKYCAIEFKGGAFRCAQHLAKWKGQRSRDVRRCGKVPPDVRAAVRAHYEKKASNRDGKRRAEDAALDAVWEVRRKAASPTSLATRRNARRGKADNSVCLFFAGCRIPEHHADNPLWRNMGRAINNAPHGYVAPRQKLRGRSWAEAMPHGHREGASAIAASWKKDGVTVSSDLMTDRCGRPQANVMLVNNSGAVFVEAINCNMESKTSGYIASLFCPIIEKVGPENVAALCMDGGSNYGAACM